MGCVFKALFWAGDTPQKTKVGVGSDSAWGIPISCDHPRPCGRQAPRPRWNFLCSVTLGSPITCWHRPECQWGKEGVQGLFPQPGLSNPFCVGKNTAPQQSDPGAQDPPFYLSATTPAYQEARVTGGPQGCACTRTPIDGKRRGRTPASPATERKGKETHRALAWKRRE